jgi:hypothetical protein
MAERGFRFPERVWDREAVFDSILRTVADRRVLYLEFGVYKGNSMQYWSRRLTNPDAHLAGFDSFEGLPEAGGFWGKGEFDTNGTVPHIDDARVEFYKGWFRDTLPAYTLPDHDVLVINMDADKPSHRRRVPRGASSPRSSRRARRRRASERAARS